MSNSICTPHYLFSESNPILKFAEAVSKNDRETDVNFRIRNLFKKLKVEISFSPNQQNDISHEGNWYKKKPFPTWVFDTIKRDFSSDHLTFLENIVNQYETVPESHLSMLLNPDFQLPGDNIDNYLIDDIKNLIDLKFPFKRISISHNTSEEGMNLIKSIPSISSIAFNFFFFEPSTENEALVQGEKILKFLTNADHIESLKFAGVTLPNEISQKILNATAALKNLKHLEIKSRNTQPRKYFVHYENLSKINCFFILRHAKLDCFSKSKIENLNIYCYDSEDLKKIIELFSFLTIKNIELFSCLDNCQLEWWEAAATHPSIEKFVFMLFNEEEPDTSRIPALISALPHLKELQFQCRGMQKPMENSVFEQLETAVAQHTRLQHLEIQLTVKQAHSIVKKAIEANNTNLSFLQSHLISTFLPTDLTPCYDKFLKRNGLLNNLPDIKNVTIRTLAGLYGFREEGDKKELSLGDFKTVDHLFYHAMYAQIREKMQNNSN